MLVYSHILGLFISHPIDTCHSPPCVDVAVLGRAIPRMSNLSSPGYVHTAREGIHPSSPFSPSPPSSPFPTSRCITMDESSLPAAYRRICTWSFENRDEFLKSRHLIPQYERNLYDIVYGNEDPSAPLPPPQDTSSEEIFVLSPLFSLPPRPVPEYSELGDINSIISAVDTTGPPENPFTPLAADLDTGSSVSQSSMPAPPAEVGSATPHTQPQDLSGPGKHSLPAAAVSAELLERILSVPTILSVTYIRGPCWGTTNYHYVLPPPPEVDPIHLNGTWALPGRSMLPVSGDILAGLPRNTWLDVSMQIVWEEVMMSLIGQYAMCMNDIGLSAWEWRWVKTAWNMETVCYQLLGTRFRANVWGLGQPNHIPEGYYSTVPPDEACNGGTTNPVACRESLLWPS